MTVWVVVALLVGAIIGALYAGWAETRCEDGDCTKPSVGVRYCREHRPDGPQEVA